jgi:hypothetical protein
MFGSTWVLGKFQGYGIFWTYFGQLYNFGQCALTLCFNCFIVIIRKWSSTQMQWYGLHGPSPCEHIQCGKCQLAHGHCHAIYIVFVITPCGIALQLSQIACIVIKYKL